MASATLKKNYRCSQSLQQFYSGGPFVVSSDGSFIACSCGESIKIVDSSNASTKFTIEAESSTITALALSPNDKLLFSAGHSRQIKVWDLDTFKCLRSWKGHDGPVMGMACHGSGGLLATSGADRKVLVWDVDGGFCTHYFKGHKGVVTSIMFHPDVNKSLLFSGSDDTTVRVWDLLAKKCVAVLEKHFSAVSSMAVSEDGWTLLTAGRDKVVNLWDLLDYRCKSTIPTYEVLEAVCVVYSGSRFASSLGAFLQQSGKKKSRSTGIYFIAAGERGIVRIWTSEGAVFLYEQKSSDVTISSAEDEDSTRGFISAVMLPLDQGLLCVTADQQFLFYSPAEHLEEKWSLKLTKRLVGFNDEIVDMKFLDEEEQYLAVATNLEQVRLWESERRCCIGLGIGHMGAVGAVAFSKKCRDFFVSGSSDRTIKVWNFHGLSDDIEEPISLKAKAVVAAHDKDINSLAVAPNDSLVCSGSQDRTACIWRLPELVLVVKFTGHKRGIWCVEFSPVDQCVITASGDKTVKIWAIADGSCLKTFEGHTSSVLRASFLTRGTQFVSCGADGLVKLWTIKTNECIATYDQHEDKVWALAVGKKTEMLATGGSDAVINLWHDSTAAEKEEAFRKEEEGVLRGQELENALLDAEYTKAIQIALELRRPHKLFELFSELCRKREAGYHIDKALHALGKGEFLLLFEYIREWNTKPKLCNVAQSVLFRAFNILLPTEIIEIKSISELLEGLIPYSQRHFSRIDRLIRSTFLLDYTLLRMSVIEPATQDDLKTKSLLHSEKNEEDALLTDNAEEDQKQVSEEQKPKASGKKRKSHKSGDHSRSHKKVKDSSTHANTAAVPSQA
ncbi:transducin beta-like protein 3 isoform X2 [Gossypium hirsutum]|uniref:Transducin beta-like protein 3 isoform X2 n=1 Tax=Gossypium hirsutum TaxID=3635 RepID=A0ABM2ZFG6_GOSHI|nr:transducin beta-like protein 3 isoform X2 [Gossypium hirsutum]